jgi:hypothetical protein
MGRQGEKVAPERLDIYRDVRSRLRAINEDERSASMGARADVPNRLGDTKYIRDMGQADNAGAGGEHLIKLGEQNAAIIRHLDEAEHRSSSVSDVLPRQKIGEVLRY